MSIFNEWPYKWFGFWRDPCPPSQLEEKPKLLKLPLIAEFVDEGFDLGLEKDKVLSYLLNCPILGSFTLSRCVIKDCKMPHDLLRGNQPPIPFNSDGDWLWAGTLAHYVKYHHVRLPDAMLTHIRASEFKVPDPPMPSTPDDLLKLDWPFYTPYVAKRLNVPSDEYFGPG